MIRAFFAIGLDEALREHYAACLERDRGNAPPLRWVRPENLHLTLRFLGDVSEDRIDLLRPRVEGAIGGLAPFRCALGEPGCFGSPRSPTVLWVDFQEGGEPLTELHRRLEREVRSLGFPRDDKPWRAHLTLARNPRRAPVAGWRELLEGWGLSGRSWTIRCVTLYSSALSPEGPTYTVLAEAPLKGEVESS